MGRIQEGCLFGKSQDSYNFSVSRQYDEPLIRLLEQTPRDSLTIIVYCEETDRVISALKHILKSNCKKKRDSFSPEEIELKDDKCFLGETSIANSILKPRIAELNGGVQDFFPSMVFVHANQDDRLLEALAKHHCPDLAGKSFHSNSGSNIHFELFVKLHQTGELMALEDWIKAKRDKIEWTFDYKGNKCRGKTRQMGDELFFMQR